MIPFRWQLLGHFLAGLAVTFLLIMGAGSAVPEIERKSRPFINQEAMLAVTIAAFPEAPPQILAVHPLAEGRVSVTQPGAYALTLVNDQGQVIYRLSFAVSFIIPGHGSLQENHLIFVLPYSREVKQIHLTSPQGSAVYDWQQ